MTQLSTAPSTVSSSEGIGGGTLLPAIFCLTLACSALLLFLVQPMVGKTFLPALGGTPQVWNTCMVFFQAMLFLGYLHAHGTARLVGLPTQMAVHLCLVGAAVLMLPVGISSARLLAPDALQPVTWLMSTLLVSLGVPVFVLSSTAPLVQKWFAHTDHRSARDPYFLYAASNAGSLIALLAYPLAVEPATGLPHQWWIWNIGFVVLAAGLVGCAWLSRRRFSLSASAEERPIAVKEVSAALRIRWLALSFAPSSLLLGVTNFITTDLAPVPLLWVVPLALYLLTFILAFASRPPVPPVFNIRLQGWLVVITVTLALVPSLAANFIKSTASLHLLLFFVTALVCHQELVRLRPAAGRLTEFYLWLSLGGLLGGIFSALLAPLLFDSLIEYPLALALACALRRTDSASSRDSERIRARVFDVVAPIVLFALVANALDIRAWLTDAPRWAVMAGLLFGSLGAAMALLAFTERPLRLGLAVLLIMPLPMMQGSVTRSSLGELELAQRSFFGLYRVYRDDRTGTRTFVHGSTLHGTQSIDPARARELGSYYHADGAFAELFRAVADRTQERPAAIVGLGVGVLGCYGAPTSPWTFYEIDPLVEQIARDPRYFTLLQQCAPKAQVIIGDARLAMRDIPPRTLGLIVIDAFTSDAIPSHLLTREALAMYVSKLAPDGLLALHISNRHLRLAPVVGNLAKDLGLVGRLRRAGMPSQSAPRSAQGAELAVLAASESGLGAIAHDPLWQPLPLDADSAVWTDGHINILRALSGPR
jgi:hypothetical protein